MTSSLLVQPKNLTCPGLPNTCRVDVLVKGSLADLCVGPLFPWPHHALPAPKAV